MLLGMVEERVYGRQVGEHSQRYLQEFRVKRSQAESGQVRREREEAQERSHQQKAVAWTKRPTGVKRICIAQMAGS